MSSRGYDPEQWIDTWARTDAQAADFAGAGVELREDPLLGSTLARRWEVEVFSLLRRADAPVRLTRRLLVFGRKSAAHRDALLAALVLGGVDAAADLAAAL